MSNPLKRVLDHDEIDDVIFNISTLLMLFPVLIHAGCLIRAIERRYNTESHRYPYGALATLSCRT
jgi:hypothetical protein